MLLFYNTHGTLIVITVTNEEKQANYVPNLIDISKTPNRDSDKRGPLPDYSAEHNGCKLEGHPQLVSKTEANSRCGWELEGLEQSVRYIAAGIIVLNMETE